MSRATAWRIPNSNWTEGSPGTPAAAERTRPPRRHLVPRRREPREHEVRNGVQARWYKKSGGRISRQSTACSGWRLTFASDRSHRPSRVEGLREEPADPHFDPRLLRGARWVRLPVLRPAGRRLRLVRGPRRPAGFEHVGLWGWLAVATGIVWLLAAVGLWALQPWARCSRCSSRASRCSRRSWPSSSSRARRRLRHGDHAGPDPLVPEHA